MALLAVELEEEPPDEDVDVLLALVLPIRLVDALRAEERLFELAAVDEDDDALELELFVFEVTVVVGLLELEEPD